MPLQMYLADVIKNETQLPFNEIALLRHSNGIAKKLLDHGGSIIEYTAIQPINSPYDYFHDNKPRIAVLAVIYNDKVYGVYRVRDDEVKGTNYSLASEKYKSFLKSKNIEEKLSRRFQLAEIPSMSTGLMTQGWKGRTRTPVQRFGDGFYNQITVGPEGGVGFREAVEAEFHNQVKKSMLDSPDVREMRLERAHPIPRRVLLTSYVFVRNPDVVAKVLQLADGSCQECGSQAPFMRRSDGSPYLEVHHRIRLADHGLDTVENAIALCPNCHRKTHYA